MSTTAQLLWEAAGRPHCRKQVREALALCYLCGFPTKEGAVRIKDVCGPNFTDHDGVMNPPSEWVCVPCTWALSGRPPDTLRMFSLVYREDKKPAPSHPKAPAIQHTHLTTQANVEELVDVLLDPPEKGPWFCAITSSGKIHTVLFAPINNRQDQWGVRFERDTLFNRTREFSVITHHVNALLEAGYLREDILSGEPHPSKLLKRGLSGWRKHGEALRPHLGGVSIKLAVFLSRKETYKDVRERTAWALSP